MTLASHCEALHLVQFVKKLKGFSVQRRSGSSYQHMGATICDTMLQAGLNYRTVVAPRVKRLIDRWPSAKRTSAFLDLLMRYGLNEVLLWKHTEKPTRIGMMTEFLVAQQIEDEHELSIWLTDDRNIAKLRKIRGVGPKTVDYLKSLVGIPSIAVDRHVRTFVSWAGICATDYEEIRSIVEAAADMLSLDRRNFDHAIWTYVSCNDRQVA